MSDQVRVEVEHPTDPAGDVLEIKDWISYEVESDMFTAADAFTLRVTPHAGYLEFFEIPGHACRIYYKNTLIMTGIVEATPVNTGPQGPQLEITGRDLACLLVDDAAPLLDLTNQSLRTIVERLISAHAAEIPGVITDYTSRRHAIVGRKASSNRIRELSNATQTPENVAALKAEIARQRRIRSTNKPVYAPYTSEMSFKRQTKPGDTIWSTIESLAKFVGMTAWMTADGYLCVGRPNYYTDPVGKLYVHIDDEGNVTDSNCEMSRAPDIGDRYSDYLCLGQGRAHATATGKDLADFTATARDPSRAFWYDAYQRRRQKIKTMSVKNTASKLQLDRYARTTMEEAAIKSYNMTVSGLPGHEVYEGGPLWATDTIVDVDYGPKGINAPHYIRRRQFTYDVENGPETNLTPIPNDIWLADEHEGFSDAEYFTKMWNLFRRYRL